MPSHNSVEGVGVKVTTTDATKTEIAAFATQNDRTYLVTAYVIGRSATNNGGYVAAATFKNVDGTLTQVGATALSEAMEDDAGWTFELEADGTDIVASVTGGAGLTVYWTCALDILEG